MTTPPPKRRKVADGGKWKVLSRACLPALSQERKALPIFPVRQSLIATIRQHDCLVLIGETASGKTTQIPQYIYEAGLARHGTIACTQPRRVAATTVAQRVAQEAGVQLGQEVGYSVRFDDCSCAKTKIRYMTDGMLLREAISDPLLQRYAVAVLDEAHERTIHTDVLFGVVKAAQHRRQKGGYVPLKLVVMSATLDADQFSSYFNSAPVLYVQGRQYPVKVMYTQEPQTDYLHSALVTVLQLHQDPSVKGDILVFLTGQEEIESMQRLVHDCIQLCDEDSQKLLVCPLFAALPNKQQLKVFEPTPQGMRKVVLATNIAETSVTIRGICHVIDTGMVKVKTFDARSGLDSLLVQPVSKAQSRQRCGRAGRESSGVCYRLYTETSFDQLRENTVPEIQRCNLASVVLQLLALGIKDILNFDFMDQPPLEALKAALEHLYLLSALEKSEALQLTELGRQMAHFPLDPKLAKIILRSPSFNCSEEVLSIVAMLSVESIVFTPHDKREKAVAAWKKFESADGDHLTQLSIFQTYRSTKGNLEWCRENFVNVRSMKTVLSVRKQLRELCERMSLPLVSCGQDTARIRQCLLQGLFTNTAELQPNGQYTTLVSRKAVHIHPSSCLFLTKPQPQYLLYTDLVHTSKCYMRNVSIIDAEWLVEAAPSYFRPLQKALKTV